MEDTVPELSSQKIGHKIRDLREERGLSQKDLADKLNMTRSAISKVEHGTRKITLERLGRILEALGYEGELSIHPSSSKTDLEWGAVPDIDPALRRRLRHARVLAERCAEILKAEFDVDQVFAFGSVVEEQSQQFHEGSDLDVLVEGLPADQLFEAEARLESEAGSIVEESQIPIDLVRKEQFPLDPEDIPTQILLAKE